MINIYYLRTQYLKPITDTSKCGLFSATFVRSFICQSTASQLWVGLSLLRGL